MAGEKKKVVAKISKNNDKNTLCIFPSTSKLNKALLPQACMYIYICMYGKQKKFLLCGLWLYV